MTDKKPETPLEIFEYKNKHCIFGVTIEETTDTAAKEWCKENLERHQWSFVRYTDVYEHTIFFDDESRATDFEKFMSARR
jgi:hypothetical protein